MSFIQSAFAPRPLHSVAEYVATSIALAKELGFDDVIGAAICDVMCMLQEAGSDQGRGVEIWCPGNDDDPAFAANPSAFPHDSMGDDGRSVGSHQQQTSNYPPASQWGWGGLIGDPEGCRKRMDMVESSRMFLTSLKKKGLNVANARAAGDSVQAVQGSGVPRGYDRWFDLATRLVHESQPGAAQSGIGANDMTGFTGDPVWLEDVLREALGDRLVVEGDWKNRGTGGTMGDIWGVLIHHTGNDRETVAGIRDGRSDLAGPLSQCLITPDGKCHLIAVGPCNHAGIGNYPGIGTNNGNQRLIGFECAWPFIRPDSSYDAGQRWPDAQIITMRDATAAVLKKLGVDSSHVIGHKEWARNPPNVKWDPGNMDMNWFRGEVRKDLAGYQFPGEAGTPTTTTPPAATPTTPPANPEQMIWDQTSGRWEMLGWNTPVETLALIADKVLGTNNAGKTGFTRGPRPKA